MSDFFQRLKEGVSESRRTRESLTLSLNRRDFLSAQGADGGSSAVGKQIGAVLPNLWAENIFVNAGAMLLEPDSNIQISKDMTDLMFSESGDDDVSVPESERKYEGITLAPHIISTYVPVTNKLLAQGGEKFFNQLVQNLVMSVNDREAQYCVRKITGQLAPMRWVTPDVPEFDKIQQAVTSVTDSKVILNMYGSFISSSKISTALMSTPRGTLNFPVSQYGHDVCGYWNTATPLLKNGTLIFGAWNLLAFARFGEISITYNPYTQKKRDTSEFVIVSHIDASILRTEAFAMISNEVNHE